MDYKRIKKSEENQRDINFTLKKNFKRIIFTEK